MKVILGQLNISFDALNKLVQQPIAIADSRKLKKVLKEVNEELKLIDECRNDLIKKYSTDGIKVEDDKLDQFITEFSDFLNQETEIQDVDLKETDLDLPGVILSVAHLSTLSWLIKGDAEEDKKIIEEVKEVEGELVA